MADEVKQQELLRRIEAGDFHAILVTPPCSTWSRVRGANTRGPPMIRSKQYPWGFPWLAAKFHHDLQLGNALVRFTIQVIATVITCSIKHCRCWCAFFAEHPEDLGTIWREEDHKELHPASIWQLEELRSAVDTAGPFNLHTVAINQCCWGAPYRKPTRLLSNMPDVFTWGPNTWPHFHPDGTYSGPLLNSCSCKPTTSLARKAGDSTFRTTGTSAYPPALDEAIARAIIHWLQQVPNLTPSEDGPIGCGVSCHEKEEKHEEEKTTARVVESEEEKTTARVAVQDEELESQQREERPGRWKPGDGPPLLAYYKGESRPVNDGGGLCSPGRWPPERRRPWKHKGGTKMAAEVKKLFLRWLAREEAAKRDPVQSFWKMAAGKCTTSPFLEVMEEFRDSFDKFLEMEGEEPMRRKSDRKTEVNYRRLRAALTRASDPDSEFLVEVAEKGVPIGVDMQMPRTEAVFEEKTKWAVEGTEEEFQDIVSENYMSAEENHEDIRRQIEEDLAAGTVIRMSASEAEKAYGGRLAVAALGAVPKEINSSRVRLIHDGSYSVDVNRRIRVRDKMRFPLVDDAMAVLSSVEDKLKTEECKIRFSMVYDISKAHRLVPVRSEDWGLQAFRMPGKKTGGEADSDIYMHTRGTFGIASAAYWWGRCAASLVRLAHGLAGKDLGVWHLLFADDGWMVSLGRWFWRKLLFWFFVLDIFEFPITWKKVMGGVTCQWIGYQLDVKKFEVGISEKKRKWLRDWVAGRQKDGGALGRELKAALGRISFVAGALRHVRPFLGPLYAWTTVLSPGTFAAFPAAVSLLLDFVAEEVDRCPMRRASKTDSLSADCFRVDARAAGEEVVIGGWESYGGVRTDESRWFAIKLSRREIPWAYTKGDPFRAIASLELLAVLVSVMLFSKEAR
eukprot:Skav227659  [mRNA]  locus=scaffold58:564261:566969:- [translate_table: standard]